VEITKIAVYISNGICKGVFVINGLFLKIAFLKNQEKKIITSIISSYLNTSDLSALIWTTGISGESSIEKINKIILNLVEKKENRKIDKDKININILSGEKETIKYPENTPISDIKMNNIICIQ